MSWRALCCTRPSNRLLIAGRSAKKVDDYWYGQLNDFEIFVSVNLIDHIIIIIIIITVDTDRPSGCTMPQSWRGTRTNTQVVHAASREKWASIIVIIIIIMARVSQRGAGPGKLYKISHQGAATVSSPLLSFFLPRCQPINESENSGGSFPHVAGHVLDN